MKQILNEIPTWLKAILIAILIGGTIVTILFVISFVSLGVTIWELLQLAIEQVYNSL